MKEQQSIEPFFVKHYSGDERPTLKGNGFDGLEVGKDREEAEAFVAFINSAVAAERERCARLCEEQDTSQYPRSEEDTWFSAACAVCAYAIRGDK